MSEDELRDVLTSAAWLEVDGLNEPEWAIFVEDAVQILLPLLEKQ